MLKKGLFVLAALVGGFILGIVITEFLAIVSYLVFEQSEWLRGLKFFPIITALFCAIVVWIWVPRRGGASRNK